MNIDLLTTLAALAQVLFVYQAREGGDVYLEIKRGSGEPKHKFVSWFKISNGKATRLTFKSWDKVRKREERSDELRTLTFALLIRLRW